MCKIECAPTSERANECKYEYVSTYYVCKLVLNFLQTRVLISSIRFQGIFNVRLTVEDNSQVNHCLHLEKLTVPAEYISALYMKLLIHQTVV